MSSTLQPPRAPQQPSTRVHHHDTVVDPYAWMADQDDPAFLAYVAEENEWTAHSTAHLADLTDQIYNDIICRTKQTDLSVPLFVTHTDGSSYWYFTQTVTGGNYAAQARIPAASADDPPILSDIPADNIDIIMDGNALAEGHSYWALGWSEVSPNGRLLAYSVDTTGDERYDLFVRDIASGTIIEVGPTQIASGGTWLTDSWLFYTRLNESWRPHQLWRHHIGTSLDADELVMTESDDSFWLGVSGSRDYQWAVIDAGSKNTTEFHLIPADDPTAAPRCVTPRQYGVDYAVEVGSDALYILHNRTSVQFELATAPLDCSSVDDWIPLLPACDDRRLTGISAYQWGLVLGHRTAGLPGVLLLPRDKKGGFSDPEPLTFDEELYDVDADGAPDWNTDRIRLNYESLVTPPTVLEYNLHSRTLTTLKRTEVLDHPVHGRYNPAAYIQRRLWATAPDGVQIPISLVHHRDVKPDGTAPLLLYGYGSYEIPLDPYFVMSRLSLLDRGFVWAIAHVRGGGEMGRPWYDNGKMLAKRNTFSDFIACAEHLIATGWTSSDRLGAEGGSAGGLLMGVIANQAPDLFRAIHASVPFVDALNTILNPDLPLTVLEWEEWGDPLHDPETYAYMKSYSPYENVTAQRYPAILVTTSMNDTRVEVTEPAKWVARLRDHATNGPDRPIVLKTEMTAGHGGVSGRYQAWRDRAFELAWLIDQLAPFSA